MPRGVALSLQFRILIYRRVQAGFSAQEIFELVFGSETNIISLKHLKLICNLLLNNPVWAATYTCGPSKKSGRNCLMSIMERNILANYVALDSTRIIEVMHRDFVATFHGVIDAHPYSRGLSMPILP
jgi:hypothetical protein